MSGKHTRATLLAALLIALAATPISAGVVFQVETTYHSGSGRGPESSEMSVEKPNLKMEVLPGDSGGGEVKDEVIYRGERREVVVVDHRDKSYMVIDAETAREISSQVGGALSQVQEQMAKALEQIKDPEQRRQMQEMIEQRGGMMGGPGGISRPSPPEYRKTGERGTQAGYPCVKYDVYRDGEKVRELWVTDWSNVEGGKEAKDVIEDMAGFWREVMATMSAGLGGNPLGDDGQWGDFTQVDGFPVVTRSFEGGELESETTLRSSGRRTLDPADFEPPSGYKRRSMLGG